MDSDLTGAAVRHAMDAADAAKKAQRRAEMVALAAAAITYLGGKDYYRSTSRSDFAEVPVEAVAIADATLAEIDEWEQSK